MLRSGGASGADSAFERGVRRANAPSCMTIYLPWHGAFGRSGSCYSAKYYDLDKSPEADIAKAHHPAWGTLTDSVKRLMCRNVNILVGDNIETSPNSQFVICWTKDGKASGGTGHTIRVANSLGIPVYNLKLEEDRERLIELLNRIKENI